MKIKLLAIFLCSGLCLFADAPKRAKAKSSGPKYYREIQTMADYNQVCNCGEPVLVKWEAPWCAACTQMEPVYNNCAKKNLGKAKFYTINVDKKPFKHLIKKHKIEGLPTITFNKRNKEVKRERGSITNQEELDSSVDMFLNGPKSLMITRKAEQPAKSEQKEKSSQEE